MSRIGVYNSTVQAVQLYNCRNTLASTFCCRFSVVESLASSIWAQASRSSKGTHNTTPPLVLLALHSLV